QQQDIAAAGEFRALQRCNAKRGEAAFGERSKAPALAIDNALRAERGAVPAAEIGGRVKAGQRADHIGGKQAAIKFAPNKRAVARGAKIAEKRGFPALYSHCHLISAFCRAATYSKPRSP